MFDLNERIAADGLLVGDLPFCRVLLMNDRTYPWLMLVPRLEGAVELHDLPPILLQEVMAEVSRAAACLKQQSGCDKINIASLGNVVAQLHIHVVGRRTDDAAWPRPVWGAAPAQPYSAEQGAELTVLYRDLLKAAPCPAAAP